MTDQTKPLCQVHGMIQPGAMCSAVIVGAKHCGYAGKCEHQVPASPIAHDVLAPADYRPEAIGVDAFVDSPVKDNHHGI